MVSMPWSINTMYKDHAQQNFDLVFVPKESLTTTHSSSSIPFQMCHDHKLPESAYHVTHPPQQSQKSGSRPDLECHSQPERTTIVIFDWNKKERKKCTTWTYRKETERREKNKIKLLGLKVTLVLFFMCVFFIWSTTKGSDFPIKSMAGKSSADNTVTDSTPLTITSLFLCVDDDLLISAFSVPSVPLLRAFSKEVSETFEFANGLINSFSMP